MLSHNTDTRHKNRTAISIYSALLTLLMFGGQATACPVPNKYIKLTVNEHELTAEAATSHAGHMCGLAFRQGLPADRGMLFAYAREQIVGFWMKNTYIPLSIAFLDSDGKILEIRDMDPRFPTRRYISKSPARYALEVNQGWFVDKGIKAGDSVVIDLDADQDIFRYSTQ